MNNPRRRPRRFFFLLFIPLLFALLGGAVMSLWNAILPEVLNAKSITYWQALGLLILTRILFGGFRMGGGGPAWKGRRRGRWTTMSQEEKAKMREEWQKRCRRQ